MRDLTGQRFGRLTVLAATEKRNNKKIVWLCKCDCGDEAEVTSTYLTRGDTRSCGCLNRELAGQRMKAQRKDQEFIEKSEQRRLEAVRRDYTGERFGMLVAIKPTEERKYNSIVWEYRCDCGNHCYKAINQVLHDNPNCGCISEEMYRNNGLKSIVHLHSEIEYDTNAKMLRNKKPMKGNISGVRGVTWAKHAKKWRALINFKKKKYDLGYFKHKEDAVNARKRAEEMLFEPFLEWYESMKNKGGND